MKKLPYKMRAVSTFQLHQVLVTPSLAEELLDHKDKRQRLKKPMLVEYLAKCIRRGTWNNMLLQPAMLSQTNDLLDGQHRMEAIISSGKPALVWFAFDVDPSAYPDIDSGMSRMLHDRVMLTPDRPGMNKGACSVVTTWWFKENKNRGRPTPEEAQKCFSQHESAVRWVVGVQSHEKGLSRVQVAVALAEMYERNEAKAIAFANTVYKGDMRRPNGIRLREFLLKAISIGEILSKDMALRRQLYYTAVCACKAELEDRTARRLEPATW